MPAVPAWLSTPVWDQLAALLPERPAAATAITDGYLAIELTTGVLALSANPAPSTGRQGR